MKKLIILVSGLVLSGCGSIRPDALDPLSYTKSGMTDKSFRSDYARCVIYATSVPHQQTAQRLPDAYIATTRGNTTIIQPDIGTQLANNASGFADAATNMEIEKQARARCMRSLGYTVK